MRAVKANLDTPLKAEGRRSGIPGAEEGMEPDDLLRPRVARAKGVDQVTPLSIDCPFHWLL